MLNKFLNRLLIVFVIFLFIVAFQEVAPKYHEDIAKLMGAFPFAQLITETTVRVMKFSSTPYVISYTTMLDDICRLLLMAMVRPIFAAFLSRLFVRIPLGLTDWEYREAYMRMNLGFRIKDMLIRSIGSTLVSLVVVNALYTAYQTRLASFGRIGGSVINLATTLVLFLGAGTLLASLARSALGTAFAWQSLSILKKVADAVITNALCLMLYCFVIEYGASSETLALLFSFVVWLIIQDIGIQSIKKIFTS